MFANFTPPVCSLTCQAIVQQPNRIIAHIISTAVSACCPLCGQTSTRIHSRYHRQLTDLPVVGQSFIWQLKVHKFFCDNEACERRIFTERFKQHIQPYARWLNNCQRQLQQIGLLAGGQYGSVISRLFGLLVSGSTLLRRTRSCSLPVATTPRVLGVDDWAFKKRERYGTTLVDLEKRQVIDLLPDRETNTLKTWLNEHPGIEVISRDRASTYALASTQAAPQAVQIAEATLGTFFHLCKQIGIEYRELLIESINEVEAIEPVSTRYGINAQVEGELSDFEVPDSYLADWDEPSQLQPLTAVASPNRKLFSNPLAIPANMMPLYRHFRFEEPP